MIIDEDGDIVAELGDVYTHESGAVFDVVLDLQRMFHPDLRCSRGTPPVCDMMALANEMGKTCWRICDEIYPEHIWCNNSLDERPDLILFKRRQT